MKKFKKIIFMLLSMTILLSQLPLSVLASDRNGDVTATITGITVLYNGSSTTEVYQGDSSRQSVVKFQLVLDTPTGVPLQSGDTVTISTNLGDLFDDGDWSNMTGSNARSIKDSSGNEIATASISASGIVITYKGDSATNVVSDISTVALLARNVGATSDTSVQKTLTIGGTSKGITFHYAATSSNPTGDGNCINNVKLEKGAWGENGNTEGYTRLIVNQIGSLSLFKHAAASNSYPWFVPDFTPLSNVVVEDTIPENGFIDMTNFHIFTDRYGFTTATTQNKQGFAAGTLYPIEYGSNWIPVSDKMMLLTQNSGETLTAFKTRITALQFSYGIYTDPSTGGDTFLANFGDLSNSGKLSYTDLEPTLLSKFPLLNNIYGSGGASGGKVVTYMVEFDTLYPSIVGSKNLTNFITLAQKYLNMQVEYNNNSDIPPYGNTKVKIFKKGLLMNYPYSLGNDHVTLVISHSSKIGFRRIKESSARKVEPRIMVCTI